MSKFLFAMILLVVCTPKILEVCPNPNDPNAEYVKVLANSDCKLSDGEGTMSLMNGTIYVAKNSTAFKRSFGFEPNMTFKNGIALANQRDEIFLIEGNRVIDEFEWTHAKKGAIYYRTPSGWDFRFEDWTNYSTVSDFVNGTVIVTPCGFVLRSKSAIVVSYTINDPNTIDCDNVTFYLDANPVGGAPIVERFLPNVHFLKGSYEHFHWKFALAGDLVVITTENWGWNKRGYIVEFKSHKVASFLRSVIEHDSRYESTPKRFRKFKRWKGLDGGRSFRFNSKVKVFVLPDRDPIPNIVRSAKRRLLLEAPYIGLRGNPLLEAIPKGVDVKVLVSDENSRIALKDFARIRGLNLSVRTMRGLHGKMIVADDVVIITSANLNEYGLKRNREIGVIIYDKRIADELSKIFEKDWNGDNDTIYLIPATILLIAALALANKWFKKGG